MMAQDHNRTDRAKRFKSSLLDNALRVLGLDERESLELAEAMFKAMRQKGKSWTDF
jgi:hypothetical protein